MRSHDLLLGRIQLVGLEQYCVRDPNLAHVVQACSHLDHEACVVITAKLTGKQRCELSNSVRMFAGGIIPKFGGDGQALEHFNPCEK
ncbi:hypothetical protein D3C83_98700 [compost metagenome]